MGIKNASNKSVDLSAGLITEVASSAQKTTNHQAMDCYVTAAIFAATAGATVGNSTSETTVVPSGTGGLTLPANFLTAGKTIKLRAEGYITNTLTPTIRIRVFFGATAILDTAATTMSTITGTMRWTFDCIITCRSTGGSGTVIAQGEFRYYTVATTIAGADAVSTTTTTIDTTTTQAIDVKATWGTANASNTLTCTNFLAEITL